MLGEADLDLSKFVQSRDGWDIPHNVDLILKPEADADKSKPGIRGSVQLRLLFKSSRSSLVRDTTLSQHFKSHSKTLE